VAPTSGYVQVAHVAALLKTAAAHRTHVRLRPRVGEHVVAGSTLAWVWSADDPKPMRADPAAGSIDAAVTVAVRIGFERTLEQDPGLGMRQLCDAACKALSPAINDPYTAIQAIERLSVLYAALARRPPGDLVEYAQGCRVMIPARSFPEHLALGVGLIRRYGATEPTVIAALLRLLIATLQPGGLAPEHRAAVAEEADLLVSAAERAVAEPADLAVVHSQRAVLDLALRDADEVSARRSGS
jgi:uncharacterized membrane protein